MNVLVLDAAPYRDPAAALARRCLTELAVGRGWTPRTMFLPDLPIADCVADFKCWTRTPGQCAIDDANRDVARAFIESDVAVFLTPVTFGGYASELKKALDHLLPNIMPFFENVDGETHHARRYGRLPNFLALGLLREADSDAEQVFHTLAARNALNVRGNRHASVVVHQRDAAEQTAALITGAMEHLVDGADTKGGLVFTADGSAPPAVVADLQPPDPPAEAPRRALLVVGSPGADRSTSAVLGGALVERLGARGLACTTRLLYRVQRSAADLDVLLDEFGRADLIVLAAPLYVDSLPTPVIRLLERAADRRRLAPPAAAQSLVAIVNSGFPEVQHNYTALAICRRFTAETGVRWAGGLPLGGGGMIGGRPLPSLGGRVKHIVRALDLAADALAAGRGVGDDAVALFARKTVPFWLYRFFGDWGFRRAARAHGASRQLWDRPYQRDSGFGIRDSEGRR